MDIFSGRGRILVIRGGAIGDFILTFPALKLLRSNFPSCHIEIMGYRHICALAEGRYYADAVRSIEYSAMAGFFNPRAALAPELMEYFSNFHQIISYLYDPDEVFSENLKRCGVRHLIAGSPLMTEGEHAAKQLARPLESLALFLEDPQAEFFPSPADHFVAEKLTSEWRHPMVAIHPGSGSEKKNWPLIYWQELLEQLLADERWGTVLIIGGESDASRLLRLKREFQSHDRIRVMENQHLCVLGTILSQCRLFVGHDSGISHLAAAAGTKCLLLFGPSNPSIWAPQNPGVEVLMSPQGNLENLSFKTVEERLECFLR